MKKTTALLSLLLLGGVGSLSLLAARLRTLDLHLTLDDEEGAHYC